MTKKSFAECFWDVDFCSTAGADAVLKRTKEGSQVCKDLAEFMKQKAHIEETYGKALVRLAKLPLGNQELGKTRLSLEAMRTNAEREGFAHLEGAVKITEELAKFTAFIEAQRATRKQVEETMKKWQANKKNLYKKSMDAKKLYDNRCKEADLSETEFDLKKTSAQQKDINKLQQKKLKCIHLAHQADDQYKTAIVALESTRSNWEKETEIGLTALQHLDRERLAFIRNVSWVHVNIGSLNCIQIDDLNEDVRIVLEKFDYEQDIQVFIQSEQTGTMRPEKVLYEPSCTKTAMRRAAAPDYDSTVPVLDSEEASIDNQLYESVEALGGDTGQTYRVLFDYAASAGEEEMSIKDGEILEVLAQVDVNWCTARKPDGTTGLVPSNYIKKVEAVLHDRF
ncbi:PREDICTED: proline-serine-threonine phosphatase-interacting protein 1-like isoform X2 [Priapulus caudatus]|uniref:Proline-serine-threonine phosphatase-interacting protein 1-like isoform X2 n=1 Tax=Priapulus caudatus TaxID=37621 RepID=A0ABM1DNB4_PRICU|nr:PREDICTED: proline-serine-threonine phosphatase-interacting protein 1-like isoform X2 [Priapulus caudatus]